MIGSRLINANYTCDAEQHSHVATVRCSHIEWRRFAIWGFGGFHFIPSRLSFHEVLNSLDIASKQISTW
jgi:hypothetical protein